MIEDDRSKIALVRKALLRSKARCQLQTVSAWRRGQNVLWHDESCDDISMPDLLLFGFTEPGQRGHTTIDRIKADKSFRKIPLVLLTSSSSEQWIEETYSDQNSCVVFSPIELRLFFRAMRSFAAGRFLSAVKLIGNIGFVFVRLPGD